MHNLDIDTNLTRNNDISLKQQNFLNSTIGKAINMGLDIGIRTLIPDIIENQVIDIKNSILNNGFKEGLNTAIESTINLGKSILGIFNGDFENLEQVNNVIKVGGIIDNISNLINYSLDKIIDKNLIPYNIGVKIKRGKDIILNNISSNIENQYKNQLNYIERIDKNIINWNKFYKNKDLRNMNIEIKKLENNLVKILPIQNIINKARKIQNINKLIVNKNGDFNLSEQEKELLKIV